LSQQPIAYIDVRFCAHATEDTNKVMKAVSNVLPSEDTEDKVVFNRSVVEGHYGNPITFFEARIKNEQTIKTLIENLSANLSSLDKEEIGRNISRYFEKGSLFVRLDKQAALQGKIKLVMSDPIRIRIRFRKNKTEDVLQICRRLGMLV
jgi:RNA binding exosome subunit